ncbi:hypothetical protein scyTo_0018004, partial [Scyliorhinus torazame]|nr:hypothetical protein [Scyliorhinus torazame]
GSTLRLRGSRVGGYKAARGKAAFCRLALGCWLASEGVLCGPYTLRQ